MNRSNDKVANLAPKRIAKAKPRYSSKGCQTIID